MLFAIIIGLIAGWLTGKLMSDGGYGMFADILLGLVGAVIGNWIFGALNIGLQGNRLPRDGDGGRDRPGRHRAPGQESVPQH